MSATPEPTIEEILKQEIEAVSLRLYSKPFNELNEIERYKAVAGAKHLLRIRSISLPGECSECGTRIGKDQFQCYRCRKGDCPRDHYWLHNREVMMR